MSGRPIESTHDQERSDRIDLSSFDDYSPRTSKMPPESLPGLSLNGEETAPSYPIHLMIRGQPIFELDFDGLASLVSRWNPSNPNERKSQVLLEIANFLASKGVPLEVTGESSVLVCRRIPIEVQNGFEVANLDDLLVRMMWDCRVYGCVIAVAYGVTDPVVAIELDDVVSSLFDERETPVALILC